MKKIPVIIHRGGRQPVIPTTGTNLNSYNQPKQNAPAILNLVQRQPHTVGRKK
jgi:hypothetical protein